MIGIQNKIDLTCTIKVRPFRPTTCWRGRTWFVIIWTFTYNCFITNTIINVICKELFSCWRCKWDAAVVSVSEEQDSINMHYRYNAMKKRTMLIMPFRLLLIRLNSALLQLLYKTVNKQSLESEKFYEVCWCLVVSNNVRQYTAFPFDCINYSSLTCKN